MKIKYLIRSLMMAASLVTAAVFATGCKKTAEEQHTHKYTCTHHPEVVQDAPGNCPKCGMKLVHKD